MLTAKMELGVSMIVYAIILLSAKIETWLYNTHNSIESHNINSKDENTMIKRFSNIVCCHNITSKSGEVTL